MTEKKKKKKANAEAEPRAQAISKEQGGALAIGLALGLAFGAVLIASMNQSDLLCGGVVKERGLLIQQNTGDESRSMWTSERVRGGESDD